ncbi:antibiotic biosynthesis monooxygenase family protein [Planosporangium sp. 12N6]|uniref:antibiotic biosynthesis monooxygenase family protein n=1 Tax=Planosporangium spinosum TaxID=3402278 RepID=UPI003CE89140
MALRVLLQIDVQPGREREFERLWREHSSRIRELPDNHGQWLLRRTDDPSRYVVLTDWTDEESFRAFERSEAQQEYLRRLRPLRAGGGMTLLTLVDEQPPVTAGTS